MKNRKAVRMVLKMVHRLCPEYLPVLLLHKLTLVAVPYVNIVFSSIIIDAMLEGQQFEAVFHYVLWMISLNSILNAVTWGLDKILNVRKYVMDNQVEKMISEKALTLDYELLEKKETLEYISKASLGMQSSGGVWEFCNWLSSMIGVISEIIYTVVLFVPVFLPVPIQEPESGLYRRAGRHGGGRNPAAYTFFF